MIQIPRLLEPQDLEYLIHDERLIIVDLSNHALYQQKHVPGAVHLRGNALVAGTGPMPGKNPGAEALQKVVQHLGIDQSKHVVLCDDEGGGWAGRLAWSLDLLGLTNWSYLNGGIVSWIKEGYVTEAGVNKPQSVDQVLVDGFTLPQRLISMEQLKASLGVAQFTIWDARSPDEFSGADARAERGGHIPGAINLEWTALIDQQRNLRIRDNAQQILDDLGLGKDKHIVTHCQSHHRSSFTYMVARILGYKNIAGYDGSWAEWGNSQETPIVLGME
ncbi:MAG: Thiosulfate sulfurtransferase [Porticoccaceae bacterium UBA1117]|jgi:thiosulfate/3-mercaptopyruvate sulfurtransferase|nr:MAG: Thiosulfate sulfurtransferase [Porticoccaceae bacterium UBA1117]